MKYFKHSTDARQSRKLWKLVKTHGMIGYGIWWALIEALYLAEAHGFEINADEFWLEHFADELRLPNDATLILVLNTLSSLGLIDLLKWEKQQIISSQQVLDTIAQVQEDRRKAAARVANFRQYNRLRAEVLDRDGSRCIYCGTTENITIDHQVPTSRGGTNELENLVACCQSCNSSKGDRTPEEWLGVQQ